MQLATKLPIAGQDDHGLGLLRELLMLENEAVGVEFGLVLRWEELACGDIASLRSGTRKKRGKFRRRGQARNLLSGQSRDGTGVLGTSQRPECKDTWLDLFPRGLRRSFG